MKALDNANLSDIEVNTPDLQVYGNGDLWKLLCKASSESEGWMKSTKVMEIEDTPICLIEGCRAIKGCLVQVTTQQLNQVAEALTYIPGVRIADCGTKLIG